MYRNRRRNWKRKRQLQLFVSMFLCVGMVLVLSMKCVVFIYAEKESEQVRKSEFIKRKENIEKVEYVEKIECILQNPELPTGCEATAAAMLLNAYGYPVDKMTVADYMEKSNKIEENGTVYACHPNETFIGTPDTIYGYGAFPNVVAKAMQRVIDMQDGKYEACPLYGKTKEEILSLIDTGNPVCIWASSDNREIEYRKGWYLIQDGKVTDEYFYWPSNEHVLVLTGYDEVTVTVCDPQKGVCTYPKEDFFRHYEQVGKYAVMMLPRN